MIFYLLIWLTSQPFCTYYSTKNALTNVANNIFIFGFNRWMRHTFCLVGKLVKYKPRAVRSYFCHLIRKTCLKNEANTKESRTDKDLMTSFEFQGLALLWANFIRDLTEPINPMPASFKKILFQFGAPICQL